MALNLKLVEDWHKKGNTKLETSRGGFDLKKNIVDGLCGGDRFAAAAVRRRLRLFYFICLNQALIPN